MTGTPQESLTDRRVLCLLPGLLSPGHGGLPSDLIGRVLGWDEGRADAILRDMESRGLVERRKDGWGRVV